MDNFTLRVTPAELKKKSGEFSDIIDKIERSFNQIEDIATRKTSGYWIGEAGDKDRSGYASYKDDIRFILKRLREHPDDLLKMAGLYTEAESDVLNKNTALKTDLIV